MKTIKNKNIKIKKIKNQTTFVGKHPSTSNINDGKGCADRLKAQSNATKHDIKNLPLIKPPKIKKQPISKAVIKSTQKDDANILEKYKEETRTLAKMISDSIVIYAKSNKIGKVNVYVVLGALEEALYLTLAKMDMDGSNDGIMVTGIMIRKLQAFLKQRKLFEGKK